VGMGINSLLPVLKSIARPAHASEYRGRKVVVDGFSWLHKGAYTCARELCEGVYTDKWVVVRAARRPLRSHWTNIGGLLCDHVGRGGQSV